MKAATGVAAPWEGASFWPAMRRTPFVVMLSGINRSEIVNAALADGALTDVAILRLEPACVPPCDALVWRLESARGDALNQANLMAQHWHRAPYAMTFRLVQYQPGASTPEILDEGTVGTRGSFASFQDADDRLAMRFVRDAALGRSRGASQMPPAEPVHGIPGWLDAVVAKWRGRLMTEWWSIGSTTAPISDVFSGRGLGNVKWHRTKAGHHYLADPFPWPGTDRILCEEMPVVDGVGTIVAVSESGGTLGASTVLLDDGAHHSYPCTFREGQTTYCVPEAPSRGATRIYRLEDDGHLAPVSDVAPHARLADPTLFRWNGLYWLGCTDLDLGTHDNFCLLYAPSVSGPWTPHARWPVKIDVRGARPAGMMFTVDGRLFRPAQNCAITYGASVSVHEVTKLTDTDYSEVPVTELRPDPSGPFPHGLHTLVHDGERFWIDGKRFVINFSLFRRKVLFRVARIFSIRGVD